MAFNPLHMFRKRQKTLLAILTIGTMFLFVLGSGTKGDFFSGGWFGGRRAGETYVKDTSGGDFLMNGKRLTLSDLAQVRRERRMAYSYLMWAYQNAAEKTQSELKSYQKTPATDFEAMKRQTEIQRQAQELQQNVFLYSNILQFEANNLDNLLDFMMWRQEAKRIGVTYLSDADIERIVNEKTQNRADLSDAVGVVRRSLGRESDNVTAKDVFDALRDEFSVHEAKIALQGFDEFDFRELMGNGRSTVAETPYERFEEFRKNRTSNFLGVMALPVKDFIAEVKQPPAEADLKKLFEVYKDVEYSPSSPKPGFKEPRRISLEWVSGRADSPFYRDQARALLPILLTSTPFGPASSEDLSVVAEYQKQTTGSFFGSTSPFQLPPLTDPNFVLPYYRSLNQPENVATVIGLLASESSFAGPLPAMVSYQACPVIRDSKEAAAAVQRESNKRLQIGCSLLLSSANPFPLTAPILWAGITQERQFLPFDVVRKQLVREAEAKYAQSLLVHNMAKLQKDLESKRFKPKEARDWLTKTLPEFGLTEHVVESRPLGQYEINADPQMQPFKEAYLRQGGIREARAEQFASMFFEKDPGAKSGPYIPKEWPYGALSADSGYIRGDEQVFLYWKTEEDKPPSVPTFENARPKVEEAWRFQRARELAEKKAEELKSEAQATHGDTQQLKDLAAKHKLSYTELARVARLVPQEVAMPTAGKSYKRYEFPPDALPHSDQQTQDQVLDKLTALQKVGDTTVYADQARDQFYVATVYLRLEQSVDDFYRVYRDSTKTETIQDHLFQALDQQRRMDLRQKLLKQLRGRVASVDDKGQYNLDDQEREDFQKRMRASRE